MEPVGELGAVAQDAFLIGQLETDAAGLEVRVQIPVKLGERPEHVAVLLEPVDADHVLAVRHVVARRLGGGVPNLLESVGLGLI